MGEKNVQAAGYNGARTIFTIYNDPSSWSLSKLKTDKKEELNMYILKLPLQTAIATTLDRWD